MATKRELSNSMIPYMDEIQTISFSPKLTRSTSTTIHRTDAICVVLEGDTKQNIDAPQTVTISLEAYNLMIKMKEEYNELYQKMDVLTTENLEYKKQIEKITSKHQTLQQKYKKLKNRVNNIKKYLRRNTDNINIERLKNAKPNSLEDLFGKHKEKMDELTNSLKMKDVFIDKLQKELNEKNDNLENMRNDMMELINIEEEFDAIYTKTTEPLDPLKTLKELNKYQNDDIELLLTSNKINKSMEEIKNERNDTIKLLVSLL